MSEGDISQISVGEFETVSQLLASSESLQLKYHNDNWDNCNFCGI